MREITIIGQPNKYRPDLLVLVAPDYRNWLIKLITGTFECGGYLGQRSEWVTYPDRMPANRHAVKFLSKFYAGLRTASKEINGISPTHAILDDVGVNS